MPGGDAETALSTVDDGLGGNRASANVRERPPAKHTVNEPAGVAEVAASQPRKDSPWSAT